MGAPGTTASDVERQQQSDGKAGPSPRSDRSGSRSPPIRSLVQIHHGPGAMTDAVSRLEIGVDGTEALSPRPAPQSKWYHALTNMVVALIGPAVLAFPWVMSRLGLVAGVVFMILSGGLAWYSAMIMAHHHVTEDGTRRGKFRELTEYALGPTAAFWMATVPQHTYLIGQVVVAIIASGQLMHVMYNVLCELSAGECGPLDTRYFIALFTGICMIGAPAPGIHDLWIMSLVGGVSSIGFIVLAVYICIEQIAFNGAGGGRTCPDLQEGEIDFLFEQLAAIGIVIGAYSVNPLLLEIQATLATPPSPFVSMRRVLGIGFTVIQILYLTVGIVGYGALGDCASDNILNQALPRGSTLLALFVANLLFILESLGSAQLMVQPVVDEVDLAIANLSPGKSWVHEHPRALRFITGPLIMLLFGAAAVVFPSLSGVLGLVCSITSVPTTFITPFCIHLTLTRRTVGVLERTMCTSMVIAGVFLSVLGAWGSGAMLIAL